jgi:hypothetical protein
MMRVLVTFLFGLVLLIRPFVIPLVIFVAVFIAAVLPFMSVRAVDRLLTPAIPYCMAGVWMGRAGTQKDLGIGILIVTLGRWLDGVDGVVSRSVAALPPSKFVLLTPITIVIAAVMVVIAPIIAAIVMTPIITSVV